LNIDLEDRERRVDLDALFKRTRRLIDIAGDATQTTQARCAASFELILAGSALLELTQPPRAPLR
jgi:hypothetical protein